MLQHPKELLQTPFCVARLGEETPLSIHKIRVGIALSAASVWQLSVREVTQCSGRSVAYG